MYIGRVDDKAIVRRTPRTLARLDGKRAVRCKRTFLTRERMLY